jgi:beta-phosphoglucomutase
MKHQQSEQGILFDFDGVTVRSMEQHFAAWVKALQEKNIVLNPMDFFVLEGQGVETVARNLGKRYGLNDTQITEVTRRKIEWYQLHMRIEFYDHFFELLATLKSRAIKMGVVTGGMRERVEKIIANHFKDYFQCLVTVDDVQNGKPHPEPFLRGAELLNIAPNDCIAVENAPLGIESARQAGMTVIAVTTTLGAEYLRQAHYIVNNFREVEETILMLIDKK